MSKPLQPDSDSFSSAHQKPMLDEAPPILGTWGRVYVAVLLYLACVITLFYLFEKAFTS